MIYYYFGELGFFTDIILGELELFVTTKPELRGQITIYSYTNFCKVIENLFPDFFTFKYQDYLFPARARHDFTDPTYEKGKYKDMKRLEELFETPSGEIISQSYINVNNGIVTETKFNNDEIKFLGKPLTKKVVVNNPKAIELMSKYKRTFVYFFRLRPRIDTHRNFWHTPEIEEFLDQLLNMDDALHVIYMCSDECYYPPFINYRVAFTFQKNIYECTNFEESICFFNNCSTFISNDSGLIEFAKVCGVKEVVIMPNYKWANRWLGYYVSHNFGTNILTVNRK